MKFFSFILAFLVLTTSCSTTRHYKKVATDSEVTPKKKAIIAPWVSANFPVEESYTKGKDSVTVDTLYNADVVDSLKTELDLLIIAINGNRDGEEGDSIEYIDVDSLKAAILAKCKGTKVIRTVTHRVDTLKQKDGAALFTMKTQLDKCNAESVVKDEQIKNLQAQVLAANEERDEVKGEKNMLWIYLVVALIAILVLGYLLVKPKWI